MPFLRNFKITIPLIIGVVLLALPLTRRYVALQMGWQRTEAGSILPRSHLLKDDPVWRSDWFQLLEKLQHHGKIPNEGDQYLRSHPQDLALLSARIRYLLSICPMPRRAGELDAVSPDMEKQYQASEKRDIARRKVLLPLIRELSLLGQRQEPQNAFFDWLLSFVAYAQYQDDLGWRYLQSAERKTQFDAHDLDFANDVLQREQRVLGRPLLWEEKYAAKIYISPHAIFRTHVLGEWLRWKIIQKMRAGDFQQALQIQETLSRLGNLITREAKLYFTASLGNRLLAHAYFAPLDISVKTDAGMPFQRPKMTQKERFYKVARFADTHHLSQLHQIGQDYLRSRRYVSRVQDQATEQFSGSITKPQFTVMRLSWIFGVLLFSLIGGAAAGWLCLRWLKSPAQTPPNLARFATVASWILWIIPCAALFGFVFSGDRWEFNIWVWDIGNASVITLLFPLFLAFIINLLIVLLLPWRRILENQTVSFWTQIKVRNL